MSDKTGISWTEATWNPTTGCSHVSEGCRYCYAEALSLRMGWSKKPWTAQNAAENVKLYPERLDLLLRWKKPKRVFVDSMSDLFHEQVPDEFVFQVFKRMAYAPRHIFQILTKRPKRMYDLVPKIRGRLPDRLEHVWLGVSVENQRAADERIPLLLQTPAAVRFISCEPLLEKVDILAALIVGDMRLGNKIDWVIVGGESGAHARPMDLAWLLSIVEQCKVAGIPVFVKQDTGRYPGKQGGIPDDIWALKEYPEEATR